MPIAALVIGIVGLVFSFIPCLGMYAIPLTLLAVVLGALRLKSGTAGRGMAIAGFVCGLVGTGIAGWWLYAYLKVQSVVDEGVSAYEAKQREIHAQQAAGSAAPAPAPVAR